MSFSRFCVFDSAREGMARSCRGAWLRGCWKCWVARGVGFVETSELTSGERGKRAGFRSTIRVSSGRAGARIGLRAIGEPRRQVGAHSIPRVQKAWANRPAGSSRSSTDRSLPLSYVALAALGGQEGQLGWVTSCESSRHEALRDARASCSARNCRSWAFLRTPRAERRPSAAGS